VFSSTHAITWSALFGDETVDSDWSVLCDAMLAGRRLDDSVILPDWRVKTERLKFLAHWKSLSNQLLNGTPGSMGSRPVRMKWAEFVKCDLYDLGRALFPSVFSEQSASFQDMQTTKTAEVDKPANKFTCFCPNNIKLVATCHALCLCPCAKCQKNLIVEDLPPPKEGRQLRVRKSKPPPITKVGVTVLLTGKETTYVAGEVLLIPTIKGPLFGKLTKRKTFFTYSNGANDGSLLNVRYMKPLQDDTPAGKYVFCEEAASNVKANGVYGTCVMPDMIIGEVGWTRACQRNQLFLDHVDETSTSPTHDPTAKHTKKRGAASTKTGNVPRKITNKRQKKTKEIVRTSEAVTGDVANELVSTVEHFQELIAKDSTGNGAAHLFSTLAHFKDFIAKDLTGDVAAHLFDFCVNEYEKFRPYLCTRIFLCVRHQILTGAWTIQHDLVAVPAKDLPPVMVTWDGLLHNATSLNDIQFHDFLEHVRTAANLLSWTSLELVRNAIALKHSNNDSTVIECCVVCNGADYVKINDRWMKATPSSLAALSLFKTNRALTREQAVQNFRSLLSRPHGPRGPTLASTRRGDPPAVFLSMHLCPRQLFSVEEVLHLLIAARPLDQVYCSLLSIVPTELRTKLIENLHFWILQRLSANAVLHSNLALESFSKTVCMTEAHKGYNKRKSASSTIHVNTDDTVLICGLVSQCCNSVRSCSRPAKLIKQGATHSEFGLTFLFTLQDGSQEWLSSSMFTPFHSACMDWWEEHAIAAHPCAGPICFSPLSFGYSIHFFWF
jgi:hypothetical protein